MGPAWDARSPAPSLAAPATIEVASPPVRVEAAREISWRIVPRGDVSGKLVFRVGGQEIVKSIETGKRQRFVHIGQQPEQEQPCLTTRLHTTKPARDPGERRVELLQPTPGVYAVPSGRHRIFSCLHKPLMITWRSPARCGKKIVRSSTMDTAYDPPSMIYDHQDRARAIFQRPRGCRNS